METREQRKRRRKLTAICWAIVLVWMAALLCTYSNVAFEPEQFKTDLSVIGAFTVAAALTRVIVWLDTPMGKR